MISDKELLKCYLKGFDDELDGKTSMEFNSEIENFAYAIGASDAIVGDDVSSVDLQSDEEILGRIKQSA